MHARASASPAAGAGPGGVGGGPRMRMPVPSRNAFDLRKGGWRGQERRGTASAALGLAAEADDARQTPVRMLARCLSATGTERAAGKRRYFMQTHACALAQCSSPAAGAAGPRDHLPLCLRCRRRLCQHTCSAGPGWGAVAAMAARLRRRPAQVLRPATNVSLHNSEGLSELLRVVRDE